MSSLHSPMEHRPRTIYLSSESVNYFQSSERVSVSFTEPVVPVDGFHLAYGLNAIGFNSNAVNISERQRNNRLIIKSFYDKSLVTHIRKREPTWVPGADFEEYYIQNITGPELEALPTTFTQTIIVPDGHYTFQELLSYLSGTGDSFGRPTLVLETGYYKDLSVSTSLASNVLPLQLVWSETNSGFVIGLTRVENERDFRDEYEDEVSFAHLSPVLHQIQILPEETNPGLYDLLFTNYSTDSADTPISTPAHLNKKGLNPPYGLAFIVEIDSFAISPRNYSKVDIVELGNESIYDSQNAIVPNTYGKESKGLNMGVYIAYSKPILDPVYVDVIISLPNESMDERGHQNILTRLFPLGSKNGNNSFFQAWTNPKMTTLTGMSGFSNITIEFKAQEEKWNFFNLEFSIEIYICEYRDEDQKINDTKEFSIPTEDIISSEASKIGLSSNDPLPSTHFPYRSRGLQIHKRTRFV